MIALDANNPQIRNINRDIINAINLNIEKPFSWHCSSDRVI